MDSLLRIATLGYYGSSAAAAAAASRDPQHCIQRLCSVSYVLEQRKHMLEKQVRDTTAEVLRQRDAAGVSPAHRKDICKRLLRKRMLLEKEAVALVDMRSRAEEVILLIGQRELVREYMEAMMEANRHLKLISKAYGINDAERVVDDIGDSTEQLATLQTTLSTPFSLDIDEDDLERELDELMSSSVAATPQQTPRLVVAAAVPVLPLSSSSSQLVLPSPPAEAPLLIVAATSNAAAAPPVQRRAVLESA